MTRPAPFPRVVAEAGQCMEGDVDLACQMAVDAANAGAWAFKVQLLKPETIAAPEAPKYWDDEYATPTQRDAFRLAGCIPYDGWGPVVDTCRENNIEFMATPFDLDAVDALEDYGCTKFKIASGDITYYPLLRRVGATGGTVLLSTGASTLIETRDALACLINAGASEVVLLACTLTYPCPLPDAALGRIATLRLFVAEALNYFGNRLPPLSVGYSDHTTEIGLTAAVAVGAGATLLEKHYTWSKSGANVPDHAMAVTKEGLRSYVAASRVAASMVGNGMLDVLPSEVAAHRNARRSAWLVRDVEPGQLITSGDIEYLRPGTGTPAEHAELYIGMIATQRAKAGDALSEAF